MRKLGFTALLCLVGAGVTVAAPRPNIVIIYLDDLGIGDLGSYGCQDIRTPHMDALAASGIRFANYYTAAPLCAPSRAALMTGRYPVRMMSTSKNVASGLEVEGIPSSEITIAEIAKKQGYATGLIGKWHLGSSAQTSPNGQGFDEFFGNLGACIDPYSHKYYASEPWYHDLFRNSEEVFEEGIHTTDLMTREASRFIDAHRDRPFLLYLAYTAPHYPMVAQPRYMQAYAQMPRPRREYAAMVTGADDSIGAVLEKLREAGLHERTFVFLSSDNGPACRSKREEGGGTGRPHREFKRSLFDGGIRMPGIVSWPGTIPPGQVRDQLAASIDLLPTVAELIGAPLPEGVTIDGRSWGPLLRDAGAPGHERLYFEWADQHAVRQGKWKLVENGLVDQATNRENRAKGEDAVFLSDVVADPGESRNLRAQHPEIVRELTEAHRQWLRDVGGGKIE